MARHALVTGGNSGIGRAIAAGLVRTGHRVTLTARDVAEGHAVAEEIGAEAVHLDLTDLATFGRVLASLPAVDILVNNAGVLDRRGLVEAPDAFEEAMAVMLHGPYHLMQQTLPGMADRGWGRIVNVSSDWGSWHDGLAGPGAYSVAKAALNALTFTMAQEVPATIKINAMCPGWVRTRMGGAAAARSPEEGADTALWLATLPDDGPTGRFFRDRKPLAW